jgi:hypothetical protein
VLKRAKCGEANGVVPDVEVGNGRDERRGRCVDDADSSIPTPVLISLTGRELCVGRRDGLQQQWVNCLKGQKLFGWSSSHKVVEGQDCARTGAADANNNMENVGRRQEVPESGPGNGYKYV